MARRSPIHLGERWRNEQLKHEGEVTQTFLISVKFAGSVHSLWIVTIAYEIDGDTTPQRFEESLFLETHQFLQEAAR